MNGKGKPKTTAKAAAKAEAQAVIEQPLSPDVAGWLMVVIIFLTLAKAEPSASFNCSDIHTFPYPTYKVSDSHSLSRSLF